MCVCAFEVASEEQAWGCWWWLAKRIKNGGFARDAYWPYLCAVIADAICLYLSQPHSVQFDYPVVNRPERQANCAAMVSQNGSEINADRSFWVNNLS